MSFTRPPRERFASKYEVAQSGCWLWTGANSLNGYGRFFNGTKVVGAHQFSYLVSVGPIPDGLVLDHLCRVRHCVNPAHLEAVTQRENLLRGDTFTAREAAQTACIHGHDFTIANTYICPRGKRQCRICRHAAKQRQKTRANNLGAAA